MKNEQDVAQNANVPNVIADNIIPGFGNKKSLELALQAANILAKSSLVPVEYQGNVPNCVIALNMASRMNADPLMVMQNLYIVYGRPGWSSQFLISTFNTSGRFSALRYQWVGEKGKDSYGCIAWTIEKETGEKLEGSEVTIGIAKKEGWYDKKGSKWQTMPQQMLMYRAASWFIRAYAPELAMGMHTEEEIFDTYDLSKDDYTIKVDQEIKANANTEVLDITPPAQDAEATQEKTDSNPEDTKEQDAPDTGGGPGF